MYFTGCSVKFIRIDKLSALCDFSVSSVVKSASSVHTQAIRYRTNFSGRNRNAYFISFDYQLVANLAKVNMLIMSMFHSVPGVPCAKMER
ncbi:MAG: hypothetical protein JWR09_557 [Mucilaginibacter sp.]|nr:hypothetical protein [Mucilaginibacter sp.]